LSDVLDQSEVDALLAAVDTGGVQQTDTAPPTVFGSNGKSQIDVQVYDFKRPERVSKDQMRALQTLHEGFARNFGASLSGFLRTIVEVKVATCEQMTYSEFISGLPNPTSFNLIGSDKLDKHRNHTVKLTGYRSSEDGKNWFHVEKIEHVASSCPK
jgi:flagellar motor switch protein FliM